MSSKPFAPLDFAPARVISEDLPGGGQILRSPMVLEPYETHLGQMLRRWAGQQPDGVFLAERMGDDWRRVTWLEALRSAEAVAQSLLNYGLSPQRPVMVLSGNSVDHALLMLGALLAGVPIVPVSPAYSLISQDHGKLKHIFAQVTPGMVFAQPAQPFAAALASLDLQNTWPDTEVISDLTPLLATRPNDLLRATEASLRPNTVAKYLFTSGSTGTPKGVINTHGMLCSNQQMITQCWPFLEHTQPILLDWLPWNHTFGANHNFNLVLKHGGTLFIDGGKPAPGLIETTVENLRRVSPTLYFNVPVGFAQLLPYLEADPELCQSFFRHLQLIFYAGAALPQDLWSRLEHLSQKTLGHRVVMTSAWGSTETAPLATSVHFLIERAGVIGLPAPGVEIKLVPAGSKQELRVRGPNVTPGYLNDPELTAKAFDEDGFYKIGDAGRLADPDEPARGLVYDGRVAENFKLTSGTWVHVGDLRVKALAAAAPALQDAVITGHDRDSVGLMAWLNVAGCRELLEPDEANGDLEAADLVTHPAVIDCIRRGLQAHNDDNPASSTRIARFLLLVEPPSIDADEITDKGYINQLATLANRQDRVAELYSSEPGDAVHLL